MLKCTSLVHTVSSPLLKIKFIQNGSSLRLKPSGITYKYNLMHHCDHMFFILIEQESSDYSSFRLEIFRHNQCYYHRYSVLCLRNNLSSLLWKGHLLYHVPLKCVCSESFVHFVWLCRNLKQFVLRHLQIMYIFDLWAQPETNPNLTQNMLIFVFREGRGEEAGGEEKEEGEKQY